VRIKDKMSSKDEYFVLKESPGAPKKADYSVKLSGTMANPYIRDGDAVFVSAHADLEDGDVGIFLHSGKMVVRQYCEDSFGNIYLFTLDRKMKSHDITIPFDFPGKLVCFGRVLLKKRIPLPEN